MPELPEVETVRRVLEQELSGGTVEDVILNRPEVIAHPDGEAFSRRVRGQTVAGFDRRGKFLKMLLGNGDTVVVHLRMTGSLVPGPAEEEVEKHTHVIFRFQGGTDLRFRDPRRFGRIWLLERGEEDTVTGIERLGPEPFDPCLTGDWLRAHCGHRKKCVKECLLDQRIVAGIGNIYAGEILFRARIRGDRPAFRLTAEEWERLAGEIPRCLAWYIEKNEVTPEEYRKSRGEDYRNTPYLQVYEHAGEPCPVCGEILKSKVIGGRGTVWCPRCQT